MRGIAMLGFKNSQEERAVDNKIKDALTPLKRENDDLRRQMKDLERRISALEAQSRRKP